MINEPIGLENVEEFEASLDPDDSLPLPMPSMGYEPHDPSGDPDAGWAGKRLGPFRLMRVLGSGTMGVVFQAEDTNLHRICALKILRRQIKGPDDQRRVDRFLREARAAAALDHPSITHVYQIDEHHGWWYIAMEFMEGGCLEQLLNAQGPLDPMQAAVMAADAARGLAEAHKAGVVHRDIKPGNLMLSRQGRCKLVDFGLVKIDSDDPFHADDATKVIGTPRYMAPEVILGKGAVPASDVYALGATLYTLIAGDTPFDGETIEDIFSQHVEANRPDLCAARPQCPQTIADLVARSLARQPNERPDADTFAATLQTEIALATGASDPSGSHTALQAHLLAQAKPKHHWLPWTITGILAIIAIALGINALVGGTPSSPNLSDASNHGALAPMTNSAQMRLVPISAGAFTMGSPASEPDRQNDERRVEVEITDAFYMTATEITQAQWAQVMGDDYLPPEGIHPNEQSGLRFLGDSLPAYASWREASEFCRRLSQRENKRYRLPTEAEWEYACRAGAPNPFHLGSSLSPLQANIDAESGAVRRPLPVASFPANAWGLYDMHGNVMEWCADYKDEYLLGPLTNPTGPDTGKNRVLRGGSWDTYAPLAHSANRWANSEVLRTDSIGFRVVLEPDKAPLEQEPYLIARAAPIASTPLPALNTDAPPPVPLDPDLPEYQPESILDMRVRSVGSDTMDQLIQLWEHQFRNAHPDIVFRHEGRGSGTAIPALVEGLSHIGAMSRPLHSAEIREFQSEFGYEPTQIMIGVDALAAFVHPSNPIAHRGLSLAELDAVLSASRNRAHPQEVSLWGDLGLDATWADAPIRVYAHNSASGTHAVMQSLVLLDGQFKATNVKLIGSAEIVDAVANDPFAIGYSSLGYDRPEAIALALSHDAEPIQPDPATIGAGDYPLARPLYLALNLRPNAPLSDIHREFLRFVYSRQGQLLVAEAGFFPLSAPAAQAELQRLGVSN